MSRNAKALTIHHAQTYQPWTVPYSGGVEYAADHGGVPHIYGSHAVLHAAKTVGKLAAVFERLDHTPGGLLEPDAAFQVKLEVRAMAADLVTAALRLGNLYKFSVAEALVERVKDKNAVDIIEWPTTDDAKELASAAIFAMSGARESSSWAVANLPKVEPRKFEDVFDGHMVGEVAPRDVRDQVIINTLCKGENRIKADRMWRNESARSIFETDSGYEPSEWMEEKYQAKFIEWALGSLAYQDFVDKGPVHSNRCPLWSELTPSVRRHWTNTSAEDYMPKTDAVGATTSRLGPCGVCDSPEVAVASSCTCCEEPDVARMARRLTVEQREGMLEGGSSLCSGARLRPSGANGMQEGDLLEDTTDGFRGDASDFTQDGDVTLTSGTGIHRVSRVAKWARCKLVAPKYDVTPTEAARALRDGTPMPGRWPSAEAIQAAGDEHTAYDEPHASPVSIARAALEGKPLPFVRWPRAHLYEPKPVPLAVENALRTGTPVDVHSVDQSIPKGFACFPGDVRAPVPAGDNAYKL